MKNFYISIVSHGHYDLIANNQQLSDIVRNEGVNVVVKDNIGCARLKHYCCKQDFHYIDSPLGIGFGENNNVAYDYSLKIGMKDDDWFLVVNPDVDISLENFVHLQEELKNESANLLTVNLYKKADFSQSENSLRHFPGWFNALSMFVGKPVAPAYDKCQLKDRQQVEWASGAFLIFNSGLYKTLGGFDKKYFMYYEDVDICYRARKQLNVPVTYLKGIKAVHAGAYANRKILSKHFFWYLSSLFKFLCSK